MAQCSSCDHWYPCPCGCDYGICSLQGDHEHRYSGCGSYDGPYDDDDDDEEEED